MDLITYLRQWTRRPHIGGRHGDLTQRQPEEVRDMLRGARTPGPDRFEAEAERLAAEVATDGPEVQAVFRTASNGRGTPLAESQREHFEDHLGVDLPSVRIHSGPHARKSAQALGARAFTIGRHIVLGDPARASSGQEQARLLTHEMVHVAQQSRGARLRTGRGTEPRISPAPLSLQCDDGFGFSTTPGFTYRPRSWWEEPRGLGFGLQFQLDPELEAELMLMRIEMAQRLLEPDTVRESLFTIDPSVLGTGGIDWLSLPPVTEPAPLVPPAAGPEVPRPATGSDLLRAILAVPAVDTAITNLRTSAVDHIRSDWERLSTGERVLLVSQGVLIGGGALAAALSNEESRSLVLDQLQGRDLPVPFVPGLSFQFNLTGPDQRIFFTLDLGRLLSP